jgi:hypothetical protein
MEIKRELGGSVRRLKERLKKRRDPYTDEKRISKTKRYGVQMFKGNEKGVLIFLRSLSVDAFFSTEDLNLPILRSTQYYGYISRELDIY